MTEKIDTPNLNDDQSEFDANVETKPAFEYGEAELKILQDYLIRVGHSLLDLNKDLLNQQLNTPYAAALVKQFAENQQMR